MSIIDIVSVVCACCHREAKPVKVDDKFVPPPHWFGVAPQCCPEEEVYVCDNPHCQIMVAKHIVRGHESEELTVRQTVRRPATGIEALQAALGLPKTRG